MSASTKYMSYDGDTIDFGVTNAVVILDGGGALVSIGNYATAAIDFTSASGSISVAADQGPQPCNDADLALPYETLDIADVVAFLQLFGASDDAADIAAPTGTWDIADVVAFLQVFGAGCP